jgi:ligand-binding SRPBCC domain-containing protein
MGPIEGVLATMAQYRLNTRLFVARPLDETFAFFADAGNLQQLTPPWLSFRIRTPQPIEMRPGTLIDYLITVHGLPVPWRTRISEWSPPAQFVDEQLWGPYWRWHHTHRFTAVDGGTLVEDTVVYSPIGGAALHALMVQRDLTRIFTFRQHEILRHFGVAARAPITVEIDRIYPP